jgi:hypothetical protein
MPKVLDCRFN